MSSDNIEKVSFTFADVVCFVFSCQTELLQIRKSWKLNFLAERQLAELFICLSIKEISKPFLSDQLFIFIIWITHTYFFLSLFSCNCYQ